MVSQQTFTNHFWCEIKEFLYKVLIEALGEQIIDNLRPVTLLNNDYKLLEHIIYTICLKKGIYQVNETKSGFLNGRSIYNIHLILDILDYREMIQDKSFILFLNFKKSH